MREIRLPNKDLVTLVDDDIYEVFGGLSWSAVKAPHDNTFYAMHCVRWGGTKHRFFLHREIIEVPSRLVVDHINGNGLDNRRENLRAATRSENQWNRTAMKRNTSGFKGVHWNKGRGLWQAVISKHYKKYHLGYFACPERAHLAYCSAAEDLHGRFANAKRDRSSV